MHDAAFAGVLIVHLTEFYQLERTRIALLNFSRTSPNVARTMTMLIMLIREAGLITFVAPDSKYWHCSHIRVDVYETKRDLKTGKIKAEERLTLALRYS